MPRTTSITLGGHFERFVATQIESGRYSSASELIREGLRLLEDRELKLVALRKALDEGLAELDRGEGLEYTVDQLRAKVDG